MSEFYNGVEGNWERAESQDGQFRGIWRYVAPYFEDRAIYVDGAYVSSNSKDRPSSYWEHFVPVPTVPTEPGLYYDVDGDLWLVDDAGSIVPLASYHQRFTDEDSDEFEAKYSIPFTRIPGWPVADEDEED